jgi:hypothetical protein
MLSKEDHHSLEFARADTLSGGLPMLAVEALLSTLRQLDLVRKERNAV